MAKKKPEEPNRIGSMVALSHDGKTHMVDPASVTCILDEGTDGVSVVQLMTGHRIVADGTPEELAALLFVEE